MSDSLNALFIEDSADDALLLANELQAAGFDLHWKRVETEADYRASLETPLDIIFSDFTLPQFSTRRALELLQKRGLYIPFIIVSGTIGEERAVESLKAGATDCILKDRTSRLAPAVKRALREAHERGERQRAEAELRTTHQKLQLLLAHSPAMIYVLRMQDGSPMPVLSSDTATVIFGYSVGESLKLGWWESNVHPEDLPRALPALALALEKGRSAVEYRFRHKDGNYRWIEDSKRLALDPTGNGREIVGVWMDITERKRAEETLHESQERFRQLAENINEVFWLTDPAKSQMLYVSPAYETIWGRTCASLYNTPQTWLEAIHPEDRQRILEATVAKQARGEYDEVYRIVRPDNTVRWVHDRAAAIRNGAGEVYRIAGVAEDITLRRTLEDQVQQAQKMESIGQLAGGVAHDFNNILTVIVGYTAFLLAEQISPEDSRDALQQIANAADRATNLTRQLLAFSRKQVMQPRVLDLNEVVGNLIKLLKRVLGEDISLKVNCDSNLPMVRADPGMMEQIIMNLAVNARDAMPRGGDLIIETSDELIGHDYAETNPQAGEGKFACLSVNDTGCGIPRQILPRIFEPFFTTKEVGKGTGLGLATVYGIVKQHHGWINVYSEAGKGTAFRIYLPVAEERKKGDSEIITQAKPRGGTETILLVEDEEPVRILVRNVLERAGYTVLAACTGAEALKVWREHGTEVDLIVTDMVMPGGLTGRELVEQLNTFEPSLPAIYTSGYSADVVGKDFELRSGINFLQKPFASNKLLQTVREALDRQPA